jgi:hypothetical protein
MNMGLRFVDGHVAKELVFCFVSVSVGDPGVYIGFCKCQNLHFKFTFRDTHKNNSDIHPGGLFPSEEADKNLLVLCCFQKLRRRNRVSRTAAQVGCMSGRVCTVTVLRGSLVYNPSRIGCVRCLRL